MKASKIRLLLRTLKEKQTEHLTQTLAIYLNLSSRPKEAKAKINKQGLIKQVFAWQGNHGQNEKDSPLLNVERISANGMKQKSYYKYKYKYIIQLSIKKNKQPA